MVVSTSRPHVEAHVMRRPRRVSAMVYHILFRHLRDKGIANNKVHNRGPLFGFYMNYINKKTRWRELKFNDKKKLHRLIL